MCQRNLAAHQCVFTISSPFLEISLRRRSISSLVLDRLSSAFASPISPIEISLTMVEKSLAIFKMELSVTFV